MRGPRARAYMQRDGQSAIRGASMSDCWIFYRLLVGKLLSFRTPATGKKQDVSRKKPSRMSSHIPAIGMRHRANKLLVMLEPVHLGGAPAALRKSGQLG